MKRRSGGFWKRGRIYDSNREDGREGIRGAAGVGGEAVHVLRRGGHTGDDLVEAFGRGITQSVFPEIAEGGWEVRCILHLASTKRYEGYVTVADALVTPKIK